MGYMAMLVFGGALLPKNERLEPKKFVIWVDVPPFPFVVIFRWTILVFGGVLHQKTNMGPEKGERFKRKWNDLRTIAFQGICSFSREWQRKSFIVWQQQQQQQQQGQGSDCVFDTRSSYYVTEIWETMNRYMIGSILTWVGCVRVGTGWYEQTVHKYKSSLVEMMMLEIFVLTLYLRVYLQVSTPSNNEVGHFSRMNGLGDVAMGCSPPAQMYTPWICEGSWSLGQV